MYGSNIALYRLFQTFIVHHTFLHWLGFFLLRVFANLKKVWLYKFLLTSTVCLKRCLARRILKPIIFHRFTGNWKPYFNHIKSLWLTFSTSFSHRGAKECQSVLILEKWHNKKKLKIYFFEIFSFLPHLLDDHSIRID